MNNILKFRPRARPTRQQAAQWLCLHITEFPCMGEDIGPNLFHGWRFVRGTDDIIYFANGIEPGISEQEFVEFLAMEMAD